MDSSWTHCSVAASLEGAARPASRSAGASSRRRRQRRAALIRAIASSASGFRPPPGLDVGSDASHERHLEGRFAEVNTRIQLVAEGLALLFRRVGGAPDGAVDSLAVLAEDDIEDPSSFTTRASVPPTEKADEIWNLTLGDCSPLLVDHVCDTLVVTDHGHSATWSALPSVGTWLVHIRARRDSMEMSINELLDVLRGVRVRLPRIRPLPSPPLALWDGVGWESPCRGSGMCSGSFVRLLVGTLQSFPHWCFVARVVHQHDNEFWVVDLGPEHADNLGVRASCMYLIQADLNMPGVVDAYLAHCRREGWSVSRRLGHDGRPVDF